MEQALRVVRVIQVAMLVSIGIYVLIGEMVGRGIAPQAMFFYAVSCVSISIVGVILVVRRTQVLQWEPVLAEKPDDGAALGRWKAGQIVTYALCESLALLGFGLRLLGFRLTDVWPFYLGGVAMLLYFFPRAPQARELGEQA
jgi:hypothetical protein